MKNIFVVMLLLSVVPLGCNGAVSKEIRAKALDERIDVFREISKDGPSPSGSAELAVKAGIKTHHEGYFFLESKKSPYGKPEYPLLLNIDGQHVLWEMPGVPDDTPAYDDRGQVTPEGGKGMKYSVERRIAFAPGRHHVTVALPGDDYLKEIDVVLSAGIGNLLEFKPVYAPGRIGRHQNFLNGLKKLEASLNGHEVP